MQMHLNLAPPPSSAGPEGYIRPPTRNLRKSAKICGQNPSPLLVKWATHYFTHFLRTHFHALRLLGPAPVLPAGPAIVYLNHPSWHDPLACFFLAKQFFPGRTHHAPIDAAALQKYKFLAKLGLFPLDPHTRQGAAAFLRTASHLLASPTAALWITPEGHFTDPRTRPTLLRPGLAHLARLVPHATLLPLALEYTFWNQPHPELLLSFGNPVTLPTHTPTEATAHLAQALERTQDALANAAQSRDPARFTLLLQGHQGIHPVYDTCRAFLAKLAAKPFTPEHEA